MMTIPEWAFWVISGVLIIMFLFSLAFGYEHGGKRLGADIIRTIIQIAATLLLTFFLTTRYSLFNEETFRAYLGGGVTPLEANKFRFYRSGVFWFLASLVVVELIIGIILLIVRKRGKGKKKALTKTDRIIGEIGGGLLFVFWITLFAPVFVTAERTGVITNGSGVISRTVLKYPVNYMAKPLAKLIAGDNPAGNVYDEGLEAIVQGVRGADAWIEAHCGDVKEVMDLTFMVQK